MAIIITYAQRQRSRVYRSPMTYVWVPLFRSVGSARWQGAIPHYPLFPLMMALHPRFLLFWLPLLLAVWMLVGTHVVRPQSAAVVAVDRRPSRRRRPPSLIIEPFAMALSMIVTTVEVPSGRLDCELLQATCRSSWTPIIRFVFVERQPTIPTKYPDRDPGTPDFVVNWDRCRQTCAGDRFIAFDTNLTKTSASASRPGFVVNVTMTHITLNATVWQFPFIDSYVGSSANPNDDRLPPRLRSFITLRDVVLGGTMTFQKAMYGAVVTLDGASTVPGGARFASPLIFSDVESSDVVVQFCVFAASGLQQRSSSMFSGDFINSAFSILGSAWRIESQVPHQGVFWFQGNATGSTVWVVNSSVTLVNIGPGQLGYPTAGDISTKVFWFSAARSWPTGVVVIGSSLLVSDWRVDVIGFADGTLPTQYATRGLASRITGLVVGRLVHIMGSRVQLNATEDGARFIVFSPTLNGTSTSSMMETRNISSLSVRLVDSQLSVMTQAASVQFLVTRGINVTAIRTERALLRDESFTTASNVPNMSLAQEQRRFGGPAPKVVLSRSNVSASVVLDDMLTAYSQLPPFAWSSSLQCGHNSYGAILTDASALAVYNRALLAVEYVYSINPPPSIHRDVAATYPCSTASVPTVIDLLARGMLVSTAQLLAWYAPPSPRYPSANMSGAWRSDPASVYGTRFAPLRSSPTDLPWSVASSITVDVSRCHVMTFVAQYATSLDATTVAFVQFSAPFIVGLHAMFNDNVFQIGAAPTVQVFHMAGPSAGPSNNDDQGSWDDQHSVLRDSTLLFYNLSVLLAQFVASSVSSVLDVTSQASRLPLMVLRPRVDRPAAPPTFAASILAFTSLANVWLDISGQSSMVLDQAAVSAQVIVVSPNASLRDVVISIRGQSALTLTLTDPRAMPPSVPAFIGLIFQLPLSVLRVRDGTPPVAKRLVIQIIERSLIQVYCQAAMGNPMMHVLSFSFVIVDRVTWIIAGRAHLNVATDVASHSAVTMLRMGRAPMVAAASTSPSNGIAGVTVWASLLMSDANVTVKAAGSIYVFPTSHALIKHLLFVMTHGANVDITSTEKSVTFAAYALSSFASTVNSVDGGRAFFLADVTHLIFQSSIRVSAVVVASVLTVNDGSPGAPYGVVLGHQQMVIASTIAVTVGNGVANGGGAAVLSRTSYVAGCYGYVAQAPGGLNAHAALTTPLFAKPVSAMTNAGAASFPSSVPHRTLEGNAGAPPRVISQPINTMGQGATDFVVRRFCTVAVVQQSNIAVNSSGSQEVAVGRQRFDRVALAWAGTLPIIDLSETAGASNEVLYPSRTASTAAINAASHATTLTPEYFFALFPSLLAYTTTTLEFINGFEDTNLAQFYERDYAGRKPPPNATGLSLAPLIVGRKRLPLLNFSLLVLFNVTNLTAPTTVANSTTPSALPPLGVSSSFYPSALRFWLERRGAWIGGGRGGDAYQQQGGGATRQPWGNLSSIAGGREWVFNATLDQLTPWTAILHGHSSGGVSSASPRQDVGSTGDSDGSVETAMSVLVTNCDVRVLHDGGAAVELFSLLSTAPEDSLPFIDDAVDPSMLDKWNATFINQRLLPSETRLPPRRGSDAAALLVGPSAVVILASSSLLSAPLAMASVVPPPFGSEATSFVTFATFARFSFVTLRIDGCNLTAAGSGNLSVFSSARCDADPQGNTPFCNNAASPVDFGFEATMVRSHVRLVRSGEGIIDDATASALVASFLYGLVAPSRRPAPRPEWTWRRRLWTLVTIESSTCSVNVSGVIRVSRLTLTNASLNVAVIIRNSSLRLTSTAGVIVLAKVGIDATLPVALSSSDCDEKSSANGTNDVMTLFAAGCALSPACVFVMADSVVVSRNPSALTTHILYVVVISGQATSILVAATRSVFDLVTGSVVVARLDAIAGGFSKTARGQLGNEIAAADTVMTVNLSDAVLWRGTVIPYLPWGTFPSATAAALPLVFGNASTIALNATDTFAAAGFTVRRLNDDYDDEVITSWAKAAAPFSWLVTAMAGWMDDPTVRSIATQQNMSAPERKGEVSSVSLSGHGATIYSSDCVVTVAANTELDSYFFVGRATVKSDRTSPTAAIAQLDVGATIEDFSIFVQNANVTVRRRTGDTVTHPTGGAIYIAVALANGVTGRPVRNVLLSVTRSTILVGAWAAGSGQYSHAHGRTWIVCVRAEDGWQGLQGAIVTMIATVVDVDSFELDVMTVTDMPIVRDVQLVSENVTVRHITEQARAPFTMHTSIGSLQLTSIGADSLVVADIAACEATRVQHVSRTLQLRTASTSPWYNCTGSTASIADLWPRAAPGEQSIRSNVSDVLIAFLHGSVAVSHVADLSLASCGQSVESRRVVVLLKGASIVVRDAVGAVRILTLAGTASNHQHISFLVAASLVSVQNSATVKATSIGSATVMLAIGYGSSQVVESSGLALTFVDSTIVLVNITAPSLLLIPRCKNADVVMHRASITVLRSDAKYIGPLSILLFATPVAKVFVSIAHSQMWIATPSIEVIGVGSAPMSILSFTQSATEVTAMLDSVNVTIESPATGTTAQTLWSLMAFAGDVSAVSIAWQSVTFMLRAAQGPPSPDYASLALATVLYFSRELRDSSVVIANSTVDVTGPAVTCVYVIDAANSSIVVARSRFAARLTTLSVSGFLSATRFGFFLFIVFDGNPSSSATLARFRCLISASRVEIVGDRQPPGIVDPRMPTLLSLHTGVTDTGCVLAVADCLVTLSWLRAAEEASVLTIEASTSGGRATGLTQYVTDSSISCNVPLTTRFRVLRWGGAAKSVFVVHRCAFRLYNTTGGNSQRLLSSQQNTVLDEVHLDARDLRLLFSGARHASIEAAVLYFPDVRPGDMSALVLHRIAVLPVDTRLAYVAIWPFQPLAPTIRNLFAFDVSIGQPNSAGDTDFMRNFWSSRMPYASCINNTQDAQLAELARCTPAGFQVPTPPAEELCGSSPSATSRFAGPPAAEGVPMTRLEAQYVAGDDELRRMWTGGNDDCVASGISGCFGMLLPPLQCQCTWDPQPFVPSLQFYANQAGWTDDAYERELAWLCPLYGLQCNGTVASSLDLRLRHGGSGGWDAGGIGATPTALTLGSIVRVLSMYQVSYCYGMEQAVRFTPAKEFFVEAGGLLRDAEARHGEVRRWESSAGSSVSFLSWADQDCPSATGGGGAPPRGLTVMCASQVLSWPLWWNIEEGDAASHGDNDTLFGRLVVPWLSWQADHMDDLLVLRTDPNTTPSAATFGPATFTGPDVPFCAPASGERGAPVQAAAMSTVCLGSYLSAPFREADHPFVVTLSYAQLTHVAQLLTVPPGHLMGYGSDISYENGEDLSRWLSAARSPLEPSQATFLRPAVPIFQTSTFIGSVQAITASLVTVDGFGADLRIVPLEAGLSARQASAATLIASLPLGEVTALPATVLRAAAIVGNLDTVTLPSLEPWTPVPDAWVSWWWPAAAPVMDDTRDNAEQCQVAALMGSPDGRAPGVVTVGTSGGPPEDQQSPPASIVAVFFAFAGAQSGYSTCSLAVVGSLWHEPPPATPSRTATRTATTTRSPTHASQSASARLSPSWSARTTLSLGSSSESMSIGSGSRSSSVSLSARSQSLRSSITTSIPLPPGRPPLPVSRDTMQSASIVGTGVSSLSSIIGNPAVAGSQAKLASLTTMLDCSFDYAEDLPVSDNMFGFRFGAEIGAGYRGAIVGNAVLLAAAVLLVFILAAILTVVRGAGNDSESFVSRVLDSALDMHFPSIVIGPTAMLAQPSIAAAVSLALHGADRVWDPVIGTLTAVVWMWYPLVAWYATVWSFTLELAPRTGHSDDDDVDESQGCRDTVVAAKGPAKKAKRVSIARQAIRYLLSSPMHWASDLDRPAFKRAFVLLFGDFSMASYFAFDTTSVVCTALINGLRYNHSGVCQAQLGFMTVIALLCFIVVIVRRPAFSRLNQVYLVASTLLLLVSSILTFVPSLMSSSSSPSDPSVTAAGDRDTMVFIGQWTMLLATGANSVKAFADILVLILWLTQRGHHKLTHWLTMTSSRRAESRAARQQSRLELIKRLQTAEVAEMLVPLMAERPGGDPRDRGRDGAIDMGAPNSVEMTERCDDLFDAKVFRRGGKGQLPVTKASHTTEHVSQEDNGLLELLNMLDDQPLGGDEKGRASDDADLADLLGWGAANPLAGLTRISTHRADVVA